MMGVKMDDLAIDVLELNLVVFPAHLDSYLFLAKIHLQKDDRAGAESVLEKPWLSASEIRP